MSDSTFRNAWARVDTERQGCIGENSLSALLRFIGLVPTRQLLVSVLSSTTGQTDAAHPNAGLISYAELQNW